MNTSTTGGKGKGGEAEDSSTTTTQQTTFAVGDRVETGSGNFVTLYAYEQPSPPGEYNEPEPGQEFAAVDVEYCLGPKIDPDSSFESIGPDAFELQMGDNTRRSFDLSGREPALHYTDVGNPGDCLRGWVTFQVPAAVRPAALILLNTEPLIRFAL